MCALKGLFIVVPPEGVFVLLWELAAAPSLCPAVQVPGQALGFSQISSLAHTLQLGFLTLEFCRLFPSVKIISNPNPACQCYLQSLLVLCQLST